MARTFKLPRTTREIQGQNAARLQSRVEQAEAGFQAAMENLLANPDVSFLYSSIENYAFGENETVFSKFFQNELMFEGAEEVLKWFDQWTGYNQKTGDDMRWLYTKMVRIVAHLLVPEWADSWSPEKVAKELEKKGDQCHEMWNKAVEVIRVIRLAFNIEKDGELGLAYRELKEAYAAAETLPVAPYRQATRRRQG